MTEGTVSRCNKLIFTRGLVCRYNYLMMAESFAETCSRDVCMDDACPTRFRAAAMYSSDQKYLTFHPWYPDGLFARHQLRDRENEMYKRKHLYLRDVLVYDTCICSKVSNHECGSDCSCSFRADPESLQTLAITTILSSFRVKSSVRDFCRFFQETCGYFPSFEVSKKLSLDDEIYYYLPPLGAFDGLMHRFLRILSVEYFDRHTSLKKYLGYFPFWDGDAILRFWTRNYAFVVSNMKLYCPGSDGLCQIVVSNFFCNVVNPLYPGIHKFCTCKVAEPCNRICFCACGVECAYQPLVDLFEVCMSGSKVMHRMVRCYQKMVAFDMRFPGDCVAHVLARKIKRKYKFHSRNVHDLRFYKERKRQILCYLHKLYQAVDTKSWSYEY